MRPPPAWHAAAHPAQGLPVCLLTLLLLLPILRLLAGVCVQVSYHQRAPQLNDEIKIRLPDVITPNHHLVFR